MLILVIPSVELGNPVVACSLHEGDATFTCSGVWLLGNTDCEPTIELQIRENPEEQRTNVLWTWTRHP